ncbi:glycosyltransferase family 1 protein, partial [Candidatus Parcubacteria bacterium]
MKIAQVNKYYYDRAGAENYMLRLSEILENKGHIVAPFSMHHSENLPTPWSKYFVSDMHTERGPAKGFKKISQFTRALWSLEAYKKMSAFLTDFQPDIVHIHNIYTQLSPSVLAACRRFNIPVVMTVHDYALVSANYALWSGDQPLDWHRLGVLRTAKTRFIKNSFSATLALAIVQKIHYHFKLFDRYIDYYLPVTNFQKKILQDYEFPSKKMMVRYPFFDFGDFKPAAKKDNFVLFIGRLEKYKGPQVVLSAAKELPNIKFKIAGSGNYEKELKKMAAGLKNVEFLGWVNGRRKIKLLQKATVVVMSSLWYEPSGIVIFEAMLSGAVPFVSNIGGMPEVVGKNNKDLIFSAGDYKQLAKKINNLMRDKEKINKLSKKMRKRAVEIGDTEMHLQDIM